MLGRLVERREASLSALIEATGARLSTYSGIKVSDESSMRHATVWACKRLLAGTVSTLPVDVIRYVGETRQPVPTPQLLRAPSADVPLSGWLYQAVDSMLSAGAAAGVVVGLDGAGFPTQVELIDPTRVSARLVDRRWVWTIDGKPVRRWPLGELVYIPAYLRAGSPIGLNPISFAKESIGSGLAAERFSAQFFGEGAHPTHIASVKHPLNEVEAKSIKDRLRALLSGSREPVVMGADIELKQMQINPDDSQFIEAMRWSGEQVCRVFGVPPEMVGLGVSGSSLTYANREQRTQDFLTFSLGPWLARLEEALSSLLPAPRVVKFRVGGLLRADITGRYATYATAAQIQQTTGQPLLTVDEMRAFEDLPPLEDTPNGN